MAEALYEEGVAMLREGALPQAALMLVALGYLARDAGDLSRARARFVEPLDCATFLGHRQAIGAALEGIGSLVLADTTARG
jgi:hypothetical protein